MDRWKRTMWILWVGVLLCSASYTMAVPFLPLFLFELGVQESSVNLWAGIVHSTAFLVGGIMAPLWGAMADRFGKRKMVIRAGLSLALIYALIAAVSNPWELVAVRMLHGFVGGFVPASMAIVASIAPKDKLGWSLGMMQAGTMTGGIIGPLIGGVLATWFGMRLSFVISGGVILLASLAVIFYVKEGNERGEVKKSNLLGDFKDALRIRTFASMLALLLTFQLAINMIQPLLTLHIAQLKGDIEGAVLSSGLIFSLIGVAGIIASPLWGKIGQNKGYYHILMICFIIAGFIISTQYFVNQLWLFTVIQFVFGLFVAGILPAVNTLVVQNTPEAFRGRSFGLTASANQFGAMIGPLIGGAIGFALDIHWIFVATGVVLLLSGLSVMMNRKSHAAKDAQLEA